SMRQVKFGASGTVKPGVFHVVDDADDRLPAGVWAANANATPDGVLFRPERVRHRRVDDHDLRSALYVAVVEYAAVHQADAHDVEIVLADGLIEVDILDRAIFDLHEAFDFRVVHIGRTDRRKARDERGGFSSRQVVQAFLEARPEAGEFGVIG